MMDLQTGRILRERLVLAGGRSKRREASLVRSSSSRVEGSAGVGSGIGSGERFVMDSGFRSGSWRMDAIFLSSSSSSGVGAGRGVRFMDLGQPLGLTLRQRGYIALQPTLKLERLGWRRASLSSSSSLSVASGVGAGSGVAERFGLGFHGRREGRWVLEQTDQCPRQMGPKKACLSDSEEEMISLGCCGVGTGMARRGAAWRRKMMVEVVSVNFIVEGVGSDWGMAVEVMESKVKTGFGMQKEWW